MEDVTRSDLRAGAGGDGPGLGGVDDDLPLLAVVDRDGENESSVIRSPRGSGSEMAYPLRKTVSDLA
jgi:hypothetical protein